MSEQPPPVPPEAASPTLPPAEAPPPMPSADAPPPPVPPPAAPADPTITATGATNATDTPTAPTIITTSCPSCGAQMAYAPGTTSMRCPSCGKEVEITATGEIHEHSYDDWAKLPPKPVATIAKQVLHCQGCGATTETDLLAGACQFCGGVLLALTEPPGLIVPEAVVPFGVDKKGANGYFSEWVKSRRFAPNALKKVGSTEALKGTYIPHWTYDAQTQTDYTGERGEYYYVTEMVPVSDGRGGTRMEPRQVRHTRWYPAAGHVSRAFDDVVVPASHILPTEKLDRMGPWMLASAQDFEPQYLAGYTAVRYDVDPDAGLGVAKGEMEQVINGDCRADIGGDEQRVSSMSVQYAALMFKLMLMPLWIASYIYAGTTYQVLINANTGEVIGDRPYSKIKIALAIIAGIILLAAIIAIVIAVKHNHSSTNGTGALIAAHLSVL